MIKPSNIEIEFMRKSKEIFVMSVQSEVEYLKKYRKELIEIVDEFPTINKNRAEKIATFELITEVNQYLKRPISNE